jgi:hypothetical protein
MGSMLAFHRGKLGQYSSLFTAGDSSQAVVQRRTALF